MFGPPFLFGCPDLKLALRAKFGLNLLTISADQRMGSIKMKNVTAATVMLAALTLPFGASANDLRLTPPVILAQSGDAALRVLELEEEVRRLNGKVEELTFQLLQMQEDLRRLQQDNELRFQELEDKRSDAGDSSETRNNVAEAPARAEEPRLGKPEPSGPVGPDGTSSNENTDIVAGTNPEAAPLPPVRDLKPRALGSLTFDDDGNVVNTDPDGDGGNRKIASLPLPGVFSDGVDGGVEAAEFGPTPDAVFGVGRAALDNKRYERAEKAFRAYLKAWPNDPKEAQARYYLAEALFWQREYLDAANVYLDTHNAHPQAPTAADNLLGLGLALAGLNQREVACATFSEVPKQYPEAVARLSDRLDAERQSARC